MRIPIQILSVFTALLCANLAAAQQAVELHLPMGSGKNMLGFESDPNRDCAGPQALTFSGDAAIAILDTVNRRIVQTDLQGKIVGAMALPADVQTAEDVLPTTEGGFFVLANRATLLLALDRDGKVVANTAVIGEAYNNSTSTLGISASRRPLVIAPGGEATEQALPQGPAAQIRLLGTPDYALVRQTSNSVTLQRQAEPGPQTISIQSKVRIASAQVLAVDKSGRAYVRIVEAVRFPAPRAYEKVVQTDTQGKPEGRAYLEDAEFACAPNRSVSVSQLGQVVAMTYHGKEVVIRSVALGRSEATPPPMRDDSSISLVADDEDMLRAIEQANGTSNVQTVSTGIQPITHDDILRRARRLADLTWTPNANNFAHESISSLCEPENSRKWQRPRYLRAALTAVQGAPYRWGGYHADLASFNKRLQNGALGGDVCTCRRKNLGYCIVPQAAGWDCSGFVSYAWKIPYLTTSSLHKAADKVDWDALQPGDIVNARGRHVMLVRKITDSPSGKIIKVIHSSTSCGKVCYEQFAQEYLTARKYQPLRRRALVTKEE
jgi:cell wall-associated NlpC family hydrolase